MEEEYAIQEDFDEKKENGVKSKFIGFLESPWWTASIVILVAIISFSWGKYSSIKSVREPVKVIYPSTDATSSNSLDISKTPPKTTVKKTQTAAVIQSGASPSTSSGQVVGSKNSTKYHYPWCGGAKQISPKNLITFNSIEEARAAGYTPAANCKGLK